MRNVARGAADLGALMIWLLVILAFAFGVAVLATIKGVRRRLGGREMGEPVPAGEHSAA